MRQHGKYRFNLVRKQRRNNVPDHNALLFRRLIFGGLWLLPAVKNIRSRTIRAFAVYVNTVFGAFIVDLCIAGSWTWHLGGNVNRASCAESVSDGCVR